ncbi:nucleotide pyrophosphohydrolase [Candidatus Shapirobacteria bacterium]|nr:nucleotide pyrophosphohydrolase [Candidatus Shapirobacteria bacterium]
MEFEDIIKRTKGIWKLYAQSDKKRLGKEWHRGEYAKALAADVGALVKLTMAKDGLREVKDVDEKMKHELADCLWCLIIIAEKYGVNLEKAFLETMEELEKRASKKTLVKSHSL